MIETTGQAASCICICTCQLQLGCNWLPSWIRMLPEKKSVALGFLRQRSAEATPCSRTTSDDPLPIFTLSMMIQALYFTNFGGQNGANTLMHGDTPPKEL
eukprot:EG_transcript_27585